MSSRVAIDRMVVTAHRIDVPVDWNEPSGRQISVFAREAVAAERADDPKLPAIVWFQGGPGFESGFPDHRGSWLEQLLTRYRVLLLDQRGTGLSTPLDARALPFTDPVTLANYLRNFRQDSIVRDADRLRAELYGEDADWYVFGQSFGGFCSLTYLSLLPEHVRGVIITGGFAPVLHETEEVCTRLFNHVATLNADFYARFPGDAARVRRIVDHLETRDDVDGYGQRLSARRFLMLGAMLGHQYGAAELHGIVERADNDLEQLGVLGGAVHEAVAAMMSPATNPIYTVLHEAAYSSGPATRWAAERARQADSRYALDREPAPYFSGEAVFPWMLEELPPLHPLRAPRRCWPTMRAGRRCTTPCVWVRTRFRSLAPCTGLTSMWSAEWRSRQSPSSAPAAPGSPTSTSTVRTGSTRSGLRRACSRCWMT